MNINFKQNTTERQYNDIRICLFYEMIIKNSNLSVCQYDDEFFSKYDSNIQNNKTYDLIRVNSLDRIFELKYVLNSGSILAVEINNISLYPDIETLIFLFESYYFFKITSNFKDGELDILLLFKNKDCHFIQNNKLTIITPSCRPAKLMKVFKSIDDHFDLINRWIIVHDSDIPNKIFEHFKILEYNVKNSKSRCGNFQRNYALDIIENSNEDRELIYHLDDDNLMHPALFKILKFLSFEKIYSFNQFRNSSNFNGSELRINKIDTAMFIVDFSMVRSLRWKLPFYAADGIYIEEMETLNPDKHIFIDNILCTYNCLA